MDEADADAEMALIEKPVEVALLVLEKLAAGFGPEDVGVAAVPPPASASCFWSFFNFQALEGEGLLACSASISSTWFKLFRRVKMRREENLYTSTFTYISLSLNLFQYISIDSLSLSIYIYREGEGERREIAFSSILKRSVVSIIVSSPPRFLS